MAVIQVDMTELSDVVDVLQERGLEVCYSVESDAAFLYGSEDMVDQVDDIVWARDVIQERDFHQETEETYAISVQK